MQNKAAVITLTLNPDSSTCLVMSEGISLDQFVTMIKHLQWVQRDPKNWGFKESAKCE